MREDYGSLPMSIHDDGFGDIGGFDADGPDFIRDDVDPNIDVKFSTRINRIELKCFKKNCFLCRKIWKPKNLI